MATEADFERIGNYARMYNRDQNIDRRGAHRTVPLEAICLGYSRTGTLTMQAAMSILGYPDPYHFSSIYDNVKDVDMWLEAVDAKFNGRGTLPDKAFFDGVLGHVGAVTDAPCNLFAEELVNFYPEAKIVLVERDIDSWFKSWMALCESSYDPVLNVITQFDPYWLGRIASLGGASTRIQAGHAGTIGQARVRSKAAYRHHYRDIQEFVPAERLLNFKLSDGWGPLCRFLNKDIPDEPFPHENETRANRQGFKEVGTIGMKHIATNVVIFLTAVGVPVAAVLWYVR
ncbi:hypothetical protein LTR27_004903 [Elasticomyces elasticus]|nr:hypothetical protein LTR27_004903 [Elasticomyces elasticus]